LDALIFSSPLISGTPAVKAVAAFHNAEGLHPFPDLNAKIASTTP
jgi:hypothetical protein